MAYVFLDSNALIKLYRPEKGSTWLKNYVLGRQIIISELAFVESATTFAKHYRSGFYTKEQANALYNQIYQNRFSYRIIPYLGRQRLKRLISLTLNLSIKSYIRALDAIQLEAAQVALEIANGQKLSANLVFVTSDVKLGEAAKAAGFVVENPENYP